MVRFWWEQIYRTRHTICPTTVFEDRNSYKSICLFKSSISKSQITWDKIGPQFCWKVKLLSLNATWFPFYKAFEKAVTHLEVPGGSYFKSDLKWTHSVFSGQIWEIWKLVRKPKSLDNGLTLVRPEVTYHWNGLTRCTFCLGSQYDSHKTTSWP